MRILVVEDDAAQRMLMVLTLRKLGHEVVEAQSGLGALDVLRESSFELAILDWFLPDLTGLEIARMIRENPDWRGVQIVMYTSNNEPEGIREACEVGVDQYLIKPVHRDQLLASVIAAEVAQRRAQAGR